MRKSSVALVLLFVFAGCTNTGAPEAAGAGLNNAATPRTQQAPTDRTTKTQGEAELGNFDVQRTAPQTKAKVPGGERDLGNFDVQRTAPQTKAKVPGGERDLGNFDVQRNAPQ